MFYSPCFSADLDLGVRLKCSRACICREFPRRVCTSHPRFSFGHSFLLSAQEFKDNFQHFVRITTLLGAQGNQLCWEKTELRTLMVPDPLQTLIADFLWHKCIINQPRLPSTGAWLCHPPVHTQLLGSEVP